MGRQNEAKCLDHKILLVKNLYKPFHICIWAHGSPTIAARNPQMLTKK